MDEDQLIVRLTMLKRTLSSLGSGWVGLCCTLESVSDVVKMAGRLAMASLKAAGP